MKRALQILALLLLMGTSALFAQKGGPNKITADLMSTINENPNSNDLIRVIIVMNDQFDATKTMRQTQYLNKEEKREFVINELKRISDNGQTSLLADLQQFEKSSLVEDIRSFWIFNGVCCSMTRDMIYQIANRSDVALVARDIEVRLPDGEVDEPNNPSRDGVNQWNVTMVNADDVWETGITGNGVIVAVIDTGVNYNHTDIADNMWDGSSEGYPYHGWDFVNDDDDPIDDHSHGTHCAGTVSSYGTNGYQCGIAKNAKIMALKVLGSDGRGYTDWILGAMEFAVEHGAHVISMSLGADGVGGVEEYRIAMENVLASGVVASVAAGNTGDELYDYPVPWNVGAPGNCPPPWRNPDQTLAGGNPTATVTVGATNIDENSDEEIAYFSSIGPVTWTEGDNIGSYYDYPYVENDPVNIGLIKPDVSAPGQNIVSLYFWDINSYTTKSGTSMATPCVAGIMAMMLEANPTLTPLQIDSILECTAVPLGGYTSKNNYFGAGRVDALAAVQAAQAMLLPGEIVINPNPFDLGYRPNGAWMCPKTLGISNIGGPVDIQGVEISGSYFQMDLGDITIPYSIGYNVNLPVTITTGNSSTTGTPIEAQFTVYYGDGQQTQALVTAIPYNPNAKDVWETAPLVNSFPFTDSLVVADIPLYNNYNLPPERIVDGADAVYKLVFEEDAYLDASLTSGDNGKMALYAEGFMGVGGPDLENNFTSQLELVNANRSDLLDELTVHDGSVTNGYVPLYGFYTDAYLRMEMIYPASELSNMTGSDIQSMKFYANQTNVTWGNASFKVFLTEVSDVTINSFCGPAGTVVYEGALSIIDGEMNVTFSTPYTYNGGNLLVGVYSITTGSYVTSTWYGETVNGASLQGYSYSGVDNVSGTQRNFLPKTTFNYMLTNTVNNMTVPHGTYYLVASSTSNAWGVRIDAGTLECPDEAYNPTPSDYATDINPTEVNLQWRLGHRTTEYKLLLGTDYENMETIVDWTRDLSESYVVTGLLNNANYFWQVVERNDGCPEGVEGPIWGFTTLLEGPMDFIIWNTNLYEGDIAQFEWTPKDNPYILSYNIYQDDVLIGNSVGEFYEVEGLAYNMVDGYNFYVKSVYAGGESNSSPSGTVYVTGQGSVSGHVYEQDGITPIPNARVTFTGYDEFSGYRNYTFVADATGAYSGNLYAGNYHGVASCDGYQDINYPNNVNISYRNTTSDIDFVMDENFYPVTEVIAGYYPDATDPNSPYVKVVWSNNSYGWHTYAESEFNNAVGSYEGTLRWAYEYPVSVLNPYVGCTMTKVSLFSDDMYSAVGGNYTCTIYRGGDEPMAGEAVSTITVDVPQNLNDWIDYDLTTPVPVTGTEKLWVVWTANESASNWPAGVCDDQNDLGNWWNLGVENGYGWEHQYYGTYTMRQFFSNIYGRGFYSYANGKTNVVIPSVKKNTPDSPSMSKSTDAVSGCVNPNAAYIPKKTTTNNRSFKYYRVYRTNAYNFGPYTDENTVLLADNVTDTLFIDNTWQDAQEGVYKYGVSCVYEGNRESQIKWGDQNQGHIASNSLPLVQSEQDDLNGPDPLSKGSVNTQLPMSRNEHSEAIVFRSGNHGYDFAGFALAYPERAYSFDFYNDVFTNGACYMNETLYFSDIDGKFGIIDPENGLNVIATYRPFYVIDENPMDGKMYGCDSGGYLYEINPEDGSCTEVAYMPVEELITFTITNDGRFIICDRGDDKIKEYDPATETLTTLIAMDWDIEYGQDMATDRETNKVYWAAVNVSANSASEGRYPLIEIDLDNNTTSTIGYFDSQVAAFAITDINMLNVGRESDLVWSNSIDKNMYLTGGDVNINVTLNSGDSPEGVLVHFENLNETEQQLYPMEDITLGTEGVYGWDSFRRGNYRVTVSFPDYETIVEEVSIWDATALNYELSEINFGLSNLYVSRTGWASWSDPKYGNTVPDITDHSGDAVIILTAGDNWGDGSGYQMLLDDTHSLYGGVIPSSTGYLSGNCSGNESIYNQFSHKIPENADGNCSTSNMVFENSVSITVPSGIYDWCITNPTPGDRIWIAGSYGNVGGRYDDYEFETGKTYEFTCNKFDSHDGVDVTITEIRNTRHFNNYHLVLTDLEDNVLYQDVVTDCYLQLPVENLVDGERYRLKVAAEYSSGLGEWKVVDWAYQSCDHFDVVTELNMEMNEDNNVISWTYPTVEQRSILTDDNYAFVSNVGGGNLPYGWIGFDVDEIGSSVSLNGALSLHGGDYCGSDGYIHSTYNSYWYKVDPQTGEVLDSGYLGITFYDCAWDYSTETMYGIRGGNSLYKWNLDDNSYDYIGSMERDYEVIACDLNGQLWGISIGDPAELIKIDKTDASEEYVGSTGLYCGWYWQTCGFDHYTGKLYWCSQGRFAEVNTQTGEATVLASNLGSSDFGTFTVPFIDNGYISPVTGVLGAMLYRDGELLGFTSGNSFTDSIVTGNHEYAVRVVYDGKKRCPNYNAYYAMSCPLTIGGASYEVNAVASPAQGGEVRGSGTYINGFPCTVTAEANENYVFINWTVDGEEVSILPEYTFAVRDDVTIQANFLGYTPHWNVVDNPDYDNQSLIGAIVVDGVEATGNFMEVAALCGDECRGRELLTYYPALDRFLVFMTVYGQEGDDITFGLYDHELEMETEFTCFTHLTFETGAMMGSYDDPYIINFGVVQATAMQTGWNWYSTIIEQEGAEGLEMLESSLGSDGVLIKSQSDGFVMNYEGQWMGTLNAISNEQMYMINASAPVDAVIGGVSANVVNHPITLYSGWSWIGYPNKVAMDINDALANLTPRDGDVLKTKQSFSTYMDGQGWFGTLNTLQPAMGLMYHSLRNNDITFTYAEEPTRGELLRNITAANNHWTPNEFEYPDNMSVMAVVDVDGVEIAGESFEIAAFENGKCYGSTRLIYVAPLNRYVAFLTLSGEEGQNYQFGLYDSSSDTELMYALEDVAFVPNSIVGNAENPLVLHFRGVLGLNQYDDASMQLYPNPVDRGDAFRIGILNYKAEKVTVEIVNALGAVMTTKQVNGIPVVMTAPNTAGVYTVKISIDGKETYCRKLIVK